MDYKEKYEQALERCRKLYNEAKANRYASDIDDYETIFPELKENEDEKIIKSLIGHLKECRNNTRSEVMIGEYSKWIVWLEKQAEKKSYASETMNEKGDFDNCFTRMVEKEQKPADKVAPKFNVGDWIIYNKNTESANSLMLVTNKVSDVYLCKYKDGQCSYNIEFIDKEYRLWTIQDAKDGDVLINGSNIFIFHFFNGTRLMGYCHINIDDGRFYDDIGKNECFCLIDAVVNPATKEQRDLLFQKMHEAGYEWDADKKELKEIEQKATCNWTDEDVHLMSKAEYVFEKLVNENKDFVWTSETLKDILSWFKTLKDKVIPGYEYWTVDDEMYYNKCIVLLRTYNGKETPASKWFKEHVKPNKCWKPSEEQLKVLRRFRAAGVPNVRDNDLVLFDELFEALLKL